MTQFIVIAYDGTDEGAPERRMKARAAHTESMTRLRAEGRILCGVAILDDSGKMMGSVVVTDFPDRAAFDRWLAAEPYVLGKVWQDITVHNGALGPSFANLLQQS